MRETEVEQCVKLKWNSVNCVLFSLDCVCVTVCVSVFLSFFLLLIICRPCVCVTTTNMSHIICYDTNALCTFLGVIPFVKLQSVKEELNGIKVSFCSLTKGITLKICRLCVCVIINKRSFEPFMCLDLVLEP